jgi:WD40 repeat protein
MYKAWKSGSSLTPMYTGGSLAVAEGLTARCLNDGALVTLALPDLTATSSLDEESIDEFHMTASLRVITFSSGAGLLKLWETTGDLIRSWRSDGYVRCMDSKDKVLACGNSDGSIRVFHIGNFYLTHKFKKQHAPILSIQFHPTEYQLAASSEDYTVKIYDLMKYECIKTLAH